MSDDDVWIICSPVAFANPDNIVKGSTRERCERCDAPVWLAPSSHSIRQGYNAKLTCWFCLPESEELEVMPPTVKQRQELADHQQPTDS